MAPARPDLKQYGADHDNRQYATPMNNRQQPHPLQRPFVILGSNTLSLLADMGAMLLFFLEAFRLIFSSPKQIRKIVHQIYVIGVKSMFVIALIGLFTGMVLGLQLYYTLIKFGSEGVLGAAISLSLVRELGPVFTAIMITGRAGSSMAAEIGVMRISDQIDALEVMEIRPMAFLASPKLAASLICFPLLTAIFDVIGILGGYLSGVLLLGLNGGIYFYRVETSLDFYEVMGGFYKSLAFAALVSTICCFHGYFTHMQKDWVGPEGVSNSTTNAVVLSCVMILISDYVLTTFLL